MLPIKNVNVTRSSTSVMVHVTQSRLSITFTVSINQVKCASMQNFCHRILRYLLSDSRIKNLSKWQQIHMMYSLSYGCHLIAVFSLCLTRVWNFSPTLLSIEVWPWKIQIICRDVLGSRKIGSINYLPIIFASKSSGNK